MKTITTKSLKKDTKEAVNEVIATLKTADNIKAILFFASSNHDDIAVSMLQEAFPNVEVFGCTSMGEISSGSYTIDSFVATAFTDEMIEDIKVVVPTKLAAGKVDIDDEIAELEKHFGVQFHKLEKEKYYGIVLCDYGDIKVVSEADFYDSIGDMTSCVFTGATAAAMDFVFEKTRVFAKGKAHKAAAVVALIKSKVPFAFEKIEAVERPNIPATITKMDENGIILEMEGMSPADFYAKIHNVTREEVLKWDYNALMQYSLGVMIEGEPFMHTIIRFFDDGSLKIDPPIRLNEEVELFKAKDLVSTTREQMAKIREKHPNMTFMIDFDCGYRTMDAQMNNTLKEYEAIYNDTPMIGFATYGEYFISKITQTSAMLLFM